MKYSSENKNGIFGGLFGELTDAKTSGLAFSASTLMPYVLSFVFVIVASVCGLFYEGFENADWYLYTSFLLSQLAFILVAVGYFIVTKKPVKALIGKPKTFDFVLAIALQFGLMFFLGGMNEWFMIILKNVGLQVSEPQIPSLDGFGFIGVLLVVAVMPAIFEEVFFRGILLNGMKGCSAWVTALICGGLFSIYHQNPAQTLYQFVCGVAFALIAIRSGSILPTVAAHFLNNAFIICAEKFAWQTQMLPILIASAVCFFGSVGYLIYSTAKAEKESSKDTSGVKKNSLQFWLCAAVGVLMCIMGWISRLFA